MQCRPVCCNEGRCGNGEEESALEHLGALRDIKEDIPPPYVGSRSAPRYHTHWPCPTATEATACRPFAVPWLSSHSSRSGLCSPPTRRRSRLPSPRLRSSRRKSSRS